MIAYFDCSNGAAGDMIVASLIDAGADWNRLQEQIKKLDVGGYNLSLDTVRRCGLRGRYFRVDLEEEHPHHHHERHEDPRNIHEGGENPNEHHVHHEHRDLNTIIEIIGRSDLPQRVKDRAVKIFTRLGEAEAFVHGCDIAHVHFHEVGAVDAIVDIVGTCIAMELLGIDKLYFSKVAVGSGQVTGSHGVLPVPAPATAKLLEGSVIESGGRSFELTTPTGAAILTTLGEQRTELPELKIIKTGYGAGTKDDPHYPNVLRVMLAEEATSEEAQTDEVVVITFGVDDMTGEHLGYLADRLMSEGAWDVSQIPMYMKKGRPAVRVEVLAAPAQAEELAEFILTQSTTFGLRLSTQKRLKLEREFLVVILPEGKIRVKLGKLRGTVVQIAPEYEDCRQAAERSKGNFHQIYSRALEQARVEVEKGKM